MLETLLKFPFSFFISLAQLFSNRARLRIECGSNWCVNEDGDGNFMAFWLKVINPTKDTIYFERLEAKDSEGEVFFPMIIRGGQQKEILPQRNIVLKIPCGHIVNTNPTIISIVDATEKYHNLKGKKLSKAVLDLKQEVARLKSLDVEVNPTTEFTKRVHAIRQRNLSDRAY